MLDLLKDMNDKEPARGPVTLFFRHTVAKESSF